MTFINRSLLGRGLRPSPVFFLALLLLCRCATAPKPVDACSLLNASDLQEVQGDKLEETKASVQQLTVAGEEDRSSKKHREATAFYQCFFRTTSFANSISLGVTRDGNEFWEGMLEERREAPLEERSNTRPVTGIGVDALWSTLPTGATLYVLDRDTMLRLGIGGKGPDEARLKRAMTLARRALQRIH